MEECRHMGVPVLGPDINESEQAFSVTKSGVVRFGLSGVKGVGDKAVESIIEEREANGPYKSVYDFAQRSNVRAVIKNPMKTWFMEALLMSTVLSAHNFLPKQKMVSYRDRAFGEIR
jgi:DNA polymerase III alpha subunit